MHPKNIRQKFVSILKESGRTSSLIDDASILKRYSDESCNVISVSTDEEALSRTIKEVLLFSSEHQILQFIFSCIVFSLLIPLADYPQL
jgi:RNA exonuclease 1